MEPDENGAIVSDELGIRLQLIDGQLEMFDVATGERLLTPEERAELAAEQQQVERREKEKAQKRAAQLEKELERLRKKLDGK